MYLHRIFFSTYNLQLYWKWDTGIYSFLWVLWNFLGTPLLWKSPANWFWKENFTKNSETTFLLSKRDIVKSTTLSKNRHWEEKCIFENHISFLKYVTEVFCISYYSQEKIWECFKMQLSDAVSAYILSSKGGNQLQVLYRRALGNIQGNFFYGILFYWS